MKIRIFILLMVLSAADNTLFSQVTINNAVWQYGANYVGNPNGNGMDNLRAGTTFGIINIMFSNVIELSSNNVSCLAIIETNDGQSHSIQGTIIGRNNGGTTTTFFWSVDPGNSLSLNVANSTPLLLTNSATAVGNTGVPPSSGATFNGLAVVKVGANVTYTGGANLNGNSGNIVADFNAYTASIPQIATNAQSSVTNVQVNGWGGVATVPSGAGTVVEVGIFYHTSTLVNSGGSTTPVTSTGTKLAMTYPGSGVNFSSNTAGLAPNTTYYYRAYVVIGTTYYQGLVKSFTTCSNTPEPSVANSTQTFCSSASPTIASLVASTNVSGGSLKWYAASTGGSALSTSQALPTGTTTYYVSQTACVSVESATRAAVTAVVTAGPVAGSIGYSGSSNICYADSKQLSLSGHTGDIQWQSSSALAGTYTDISGFTTSSLNTGSLTTTTYYRAKVSSASCPAVYATPQEVIVNIPVYSYNTNSGPWTTINNWNLSCDNGTTYSLAVTEPSTPSISYINSGQTVSTSNLSIAAQNFVTVKSGGKLTVTGTLNNNGVFKVESGGSFLQPESATQTGTGTYIAERYMTGSGGTTPNGRHWYIAPPMTGATSIAVDAASQNNKLWIYHENPTQNSPQQVQGYEEITTNSVVLTQGRGYVFRGGANGTYAFSSNNFGNGNVTITASHTAGTPKPGFNLLANPYPSHFSWDQLYNSTVTNGTSPLYPTIWYRTANGSNTMLYDTYNTTLGVGTGNNGTQVTGTLAPLQSCWLRVQSGNPSITITATNAMRSHGNQNFMNLIPATIRLSITNGTVKDETLVVLKDDLTNAFDYRDSGKEIPSSTLPQLYSLEGNTKVAINGIANALTKDSLVLGVQIPMAGTYTMNCSEFTFSDLAYLEDKLTGAYIELSNTTVYNFTSTAGTFNNRFVLHFAPNVPGASAGNAIAMPTSNWPTCNSVTSSDSWHSFNATSEGVSIEVTSAATNVTVLLQDAFGNIVAEENAVAGPGLEKLNFYGLVAGNVYKVGVRNFIGNQNVGVYTICVKSLKRGGCDYGAGPYSLCQYYKATWAGSTGVSYTFTFTGTSGPAAGQTFTRTQNSDICVLSTVTPLLPYGSTYDVVISNTYTLTDGAGNTEQITVPSNSGCQVVTIAQPQTTLSNNSSCNNGARFRGAVVSSMPWVCGSNNWRWRFTEVNPLTMQEVGLPIELNRGSASNYLNLGTVAQLQNGKTYAVQTAPMFSYTGTNYNWGPTQYLCIVGATNVTQDATQDAMQDSSEDAAQELAQGSNKLLTQDVSQVEAMVYLTEGNQLNIQLTNTASNTAKRADIYDVTGKLVKSVRLVEGMNQIALNESTGIYMVRISAGVQHQTTRISISN
jgi:hypothetical protein